jgi:hypothetical protein
MENLEAGAARFGLLGVAACAELNLFGRWRD